MKKRMLSLLLPPEYGGITNKTTSLNRASTTNVLKLAAQFDPTTRIQKTTIGLNVLACTDNRSKTYQVDAWQTFH